MDLMGLILTEGKGREAKGGWMGLKPPKLKYLATSLAVE